MVVPEGSVIRVGLTNIYGHFVIILADLFNSSMFQNIQNAINICENLRSDSRVSFPMRNGNYYTLVII